MFQKRHFEWLADMVRNAPFDQLTKGKLATYLVRRLAYTNPLFDANKFLKRCGIDLSKKEFMEVD